MLSRLQDEPSEAAALFDVRIEYAGYGVASETANYDLIDLSGSDRLKAVAGPLSMSPHCLNVSLALASDPSEMSDIITRGLMPSLIKSIGTYP